MNQNNQAPHTMHTIEYNTTRPMLRMREYGRGLQTLVENAKKIEDREERLAYANRIVQIMEDLNPQIKGIKDYKAKLWNHLAYISNYELDIDYPCEIERKDNQQHPTKLTYPQKTISRCHYGYLLESLIGKIKDCEDENLRNNMICQAVMKMMRNQMEWKGEMADIERVAKDVEMYTHATISKEEVLKACGK